MSKLPSDEVDRAVKTVERGINRLVALLGSRDFQNLSRAAVALDALGPRAIVEPLGAALTRAKDPVHRLAILEVLEVYSEIERGRVAGALARALQKERDPRVLESIRQITGQIAMSEIRAAARPDAATSTPRAF